MKLTKIAGIAAALAAFACTLPVGGSGEPYTPKGNPWESAARGSGDAKKAGTSAPADDRAATTAAKGDAKRDPPADAKTGAEPAPSAGGTVLEQLEAARARIQRLESEGAKLKTDNASLSAVVEQLKKENQNLAQVNDTSTQARARIDQEMEQLRQLVKDSETRARLLADEVLQERILRVRVERELILAKVQEAENADGG
jgi:hypothetical protein